MQVARLAHLMAPSLILLLPLASLLRFHGYPLWRPEALLSAAVLVLAGLAVSGGAGLRPATLRPAALALLVVLFVDMQFGLDRLAPPVPWLGRAAIPVFGIAMALATVAVMGLAWLLRRHLGVILATIFGVALLATIVLPGKTVPSGMVRDQGAAPDPGLPPVLHLVLDGHMGPAGLPPDLPGAAELRRDLEDFYRRRGFTLYGRAFSRFSATQQSLPSLLNGTVDPRIGTFLDTSAGGRLLTENAWFRRLADRGYRIRVYQSDYLDFCGADADSCYVYPADGLRVLVDTELGVGARVRTVLRRVVGRSLTYRFATALYRGMLRPAFADAGVALPKGQWKQPALAPIGALEALDRLAADLAAGARGQAFFAHLIIPHDAFVVDRDCRLKGDPATWLSHRENVERAALINTPAGRTERYHWYFEQVRCTMRRLDALFGALEATGDFADATVIVHGDHGSLISLIQPSAAYVGLLSDRDLVDTFSTLFALRRPAATGDAARQRPVQDLFAELMLDRPVETDESAVFLLPRRWVEGAELPPMAMPPLGESTTRPKSKQ